MAQHKTTDRLAQRLDYLVSTGLVPGFLPEDVTDAATRLREQEAELVTLRAVVAAKTHQVQVSTERETPFRTKVTARFIIADPRVFEASMSADDRHRFADPTWIEYASRALTRSACRAWEDDVFQVVHREIDRACRAGARQSPFP